MAYHSVLRAEAHILITGIRRADHINAHIRIRPIAHPIPRHRPRRTSPYLIRPERLQRAPRVRLLPIREHRDCILACAEHRVRPARERALDDQIIRRRGHAGAEAAVDGETGFVEDGGEQDGLGDGGEGGG